MGSWAGPIANRAAAIVREAVNRAKREGKINSPSIVMRHEVGRQLGRGTVLGIEDEIPAARRAGVRLTAAAVAGARVRQVDMSGRLRAGDVLDQYTARQRARQTESTGKATDKELLAAVNRLITVTQQSAATTGRAVGREWRSGLDRASRSSL